MAQAFCSVGVGLSGIVLFAACVPAQERLWKRRAAYQIGQAAAAEGRRRLQAAAEAAAVKDKASKAVKQEEEQQQPQKQKAETIAGEAASDQHCRILCSACRTSVDMCV